MKFIALFILLLCLPLTAHATSLTEVVWQPAPEGERLVLHFDGPAKVTKFALENPSRIAVDIEGDWNVKDLPPVTASRFIQKLRHAPNRPGIHRMVLDLRGAIPTSSISWQGNVMRLDLQGGSEPSIANILDAKSVPIEEPQKQPDGKIFSAPQLYVEKVEEPSAAIKGRYPVPVLKPTQRKPIVVLDAGHGGIDPGALAQNGQKEKEVVLRYTLALRDHLRARGFDVRLTRSGDTFLQLRERIALAQKQKGDIFISLHADAAEDSRARGLSVYTLSEDASDAEAAALAARENKVDVLFSVDLSRHEKEVADILIDLAQRETKNKSVELAEMLIAQLKNKALMKKHSHRYAGFAVLKSPEIPSVLLELGYLSNPADRALLNSPNYKQTIFLAVDDALERYFKKHPLH